MKYFLTIIFLFALILEIKGNDCKKEDVENLYKCASDETENAFFATVTRPGRPGGGVLNETRLCEALTNLASCDSKCKELAKGIFYTVASVSILVCLKNPIAKITFLFAATLRFV